MYVQELIVLMQCLLVVFMMIFLHKINRLKKQMDTIVKEVTQYLSFLENEEEKGSVEEKRENKVKISKEEVENHLIQAVLKEYFP